MSKKPKYNLIKEVLEEQGKTQTWLAEKLDVDFLTINRYENNNRQPSIEKLYQIAKVPKVSARELIVE
jgi:putative transcriptional regulator